MSKSASIDHPSATTDRALAQLVEKLTERLQAGKQLDLADIAAQHPEHAEQLQQLWPALQALADLSSSLGKHAVATHTGVEPTGTLGDYLILREIGRGGMGVVYEAEQISLGRRVALKVLPFAATMDKRQLQRFQNEARAAASLEHSHIVPVYGVGCERSVHYYAMRFIEGQSLEALIRALRQEKKPASSSPSPPLDKAPDTDATVLQANANGKVAASQPETKEEIRANASTLQSLGKGRDYFRRIAEFGIQAAEALEHAHQSGVIHRDIKPGNLMLDNHGDLWITDFGLAHIQNDTKLTMTGDLVGTLRYMSPEQALAKRVIVDHRTDIYSLGATLYELLTLKAVFSGNDRQELLRQIAFEEPTALRKVERRIPVELETVILKALDKNPHDRYGTAKELAGDLKRFLNDEPTLARRPGMLMRTRKWARRHVAAVRAASVAMFVVIAVVAGTAGWWLNDRANRGAETLLAVNAALEESFTWQKERKMPEALAATKRAAATLASGAGTTTLEARVQGRLADLELVAKLEKLRLQRGVGAIDPNYDAKQFDALSAQALRAYGVDVDVMTPEDAGRQILECSVAVELAAILDDWFHVLKSMPTSPIERAKRILAIALVADPDPWRSKLRKILETGDEKAIMVLIAEARIEELSAPTIVALARALPAQMESRWLLTQAVQKYPADFWLNWQLGASYIPIAGNETNLQEFIRYLSVAAALRPDDAILRSQLAFVLFRHNKYDESIVAYQASIRLDPDNPNTHIALADVFKARGSLDQAIAEYRKATHLKPNKAEYHDRLGRALTQNGQFEEGVEVLKVAARLQGSGVQIDAREKSLEPNVAAPWEKAGAQVGWYPMYSKSSLAQWRETKDPETELHLPAIQLRVLPPNGVQNLPAPHEPFALVLQRVKFTDAQMAELLKQLAHLRNLQVLCFEEMMPMGGVALRGLADLQQVETLHFETTQLKDGALDQIGRMTHLRSFRVRSFASIINPPNWITDAGLKQLSGLKQLRMLDLNATQVTDAGMKELAGFEQLESLYLSNTNVTGEGLKELDGLKQLAELDLANCKLTERGIQSLARFRNLQTLRLNSTPLMDKGMKALADLKKLKTLFLDSTKLTDAGMKEIAELSQLQELYLGNTAITDFGLKELASLINLQSLYLGSTKVTDAGMNELAGLKQLQKLSLNDSHVTDTGLKELAGLHQLKVLWLRGTKVTHVGLANLMGLKQLQELSLAGTNVTDTGLRHVGRLKQLQSLSLGNMPQVTDVGLRELGELKQLRSLNLHGTQVSDIGLKELAGLMELRTLSLTKTKVTAEGVGLLRLILPKLMISWSEKK